MAAWPELLEQRHAHSAAGSHSPELETLDAKTASEIEAVAAQIIPSTDGPGAREAGVVYFIDRALSTFASENREAYRTGMSQVQQKRLELFPNSVSIALLTNAQQITLIQAIETSDFFELLRSHTVLGFLCNPSYGGNLSKVGWRQIGFDDQMAFTPPFGYYDAESGDSQSTGDHK
jgi:gluconate 2-dehydrogenase gamma chain